MIDLALVNSYILYKQLTNLPLHKFKLDVALSLMYGDVVEDPTQIQDVMEENVAIVATATNGDPVAAAEVLPYIRFDRIDHFPVVAAKVGRRCKLEGCKGRSVYMCRKCRVYLCVKYAKDGELFNCYEKFH